MDIKSKEPTFPTYKLWQVALAILVGCLVVLLFDAKGLHSWTQKLPVNAATKVLRDTAERHWQRMAAMKLEEPKFYIETAFLDFQESHKLLYPKRYREMVKLRNARVERRRMKHQGLRRPFSRSLTVRSGASSDSNMNHSATGPSVLLVGDSMMSMIGAHVKKDVESDLNGQALMRDKIATGLARKEIFDWSKEIETLVTAAPYDYVIMMIGTNDSQDFVENGEVLIYGTSPWVKSYNRRISEIMDLVCHNAGRLIWLGMPPMQNGNFDRKMIRISNWTRRQAARHDCVSFMPTEHIFADENGEFMQYMRLSGELTKVRTADGIHLTSAGARLVADALDEYLTENLLTQAH